MKRWRYEALDSGHLIDLDLVLEPGDEFEAPDDWLPEPNPHPIYKPATEKPAGNSKEK